MKVLILNDIKLLIFVRVVLSDSNCFVELLAEDPEEYP